MIETIRTQLLLADSMWSWLLGLSGVALILLGSTLALTWTLGVGRFRVRRPSESDQTENLAYVLSAAVIRIINDFRHLLALIIVLIFAFALAYVLWVATEASDANDKLSRVERIKEGLQAVVATLGGLVGSIIGYYFGESRNPAAPNGATPPPAVQLPAPPPAPTVGPVAGGGGAPPPAPLPATAADLAESALDLNEQDPTIRPAYSPSNF